MEEKDDARSSPSPPRVTVAAPPAVAVFPPDDHQESGGAAAVAATVTVATSPQHTLPLAIPIHKPKAPVAASSAASGGAGGGVGGREDCWSEGATSVLIDAWGERFVELSRGNLKQKHWQEVADVVSSREEYTKPPKTDVQCKNRIDTLKKKYKNEKSRISALPSSSSPWPFFSRLDDLISSSPHINPTAAPSPPPAPAPAPPTAEATLQLPFQHLQPKKKRSKKKSQRELLQTLRPIPVPTASPPSPESSESFLPATSNGKKRLPTPAVVDDKLHLSKLAPCASLGGKGAGGVKDLTRAILRFGEMYERVEGAKLQQTAEMEKQRMSFSKELELQRMQFFVQTQLELTQLQRNGKRTRGGGGGGNHGGSNGITTTTSDISK